MQKQHRTLLGPGIAVLFRVILPVRLHNPLPSSTENENENEGRDGGGLNQFSSTQKAGI